MRILEMALLPEIKRIKMVVQMPDPNRFLTSQAPHLPRLLFRLIPRMGKHICHNEHGLSFRQECRRTEIPHLLEHLIIELQLQASQDPSDHLTGETEWNWQVDPRGLYHVSVEYTNELLAVASIRLAERIMFELDRKQVTLDIEAEIGRLRQVLQISRLINGGSDLPLPEMLQLEPQADPRDEPDSEPDCELSQHPLRDRALPCPVPAAA